MKVLWLTNSSMMLQPTVESLDLVHKVSHNDIFIYAYEEGYEDKCFEACEKYNPDLVFFIGVGNGPFVADPIKLKKIKDKWKFIHVCTDGGCPGWWETLEKYRDAQCFTKTVNIDGSTCYPKGTVDLVTLTPPNPTYYKNVIPFEKRPYQLGFFGGMGSFERRSIVMQLEKKGLITICKDRNELWGTYQQYADFMMKCKCVLNFGRTGMNGPHFHVKNRVLETSMAQSCLFEQLDPMNPIRHWFSEYVDFFGWKTIEDIEGFSDCYYLENEQKISQSLYKNVMQNHSAEKWFDKILNIL